MLSVLGALVFGLMTFAMLVVALITSYTIGGFLLALFFGAAGVFCGYVAFQQFRHRQDHMVMSGVGQEQSRILKLAEAEQGKLTAEQAAMECRISVQQAEALLDELVNQGHAETWVSDGGSMVYVFRGLLEDKSSAEDPMKMLEP